MAHRLTALAADVNNGVEVVTKYLDKNDLPHPSFEPDGPLDLDLDEAAKTAAFKAMDAAQELYDLLRGPKELTMDHFCGPIHIYDTIIRFDIASKVPLDGDISYSDLASATGLEESVLTRIVRYGTLCRLFAEKRPGYVSHTLLSKLLATTELQRSFVRMVIENIIPGWLRLADALQKWPGTEEPSQTAFLLAENSTQPTFFHQVALDPGRAARFAQTMSSWSSGENIGQDYDWNSLSEGKGTLVELGGSTGHTAFRISEHHPSLEIIVQDKEEVIAVTKPRDDSNVSFQIHDFFTEEPIKGADAYMFRQCLHDWSDKYCVRILRALIPALKPGAKVLIVEAVVPPFGVLPATAQRRLLDLDMIMLSIANSKERTLEDWKSVFATADPRLELTKTQPLTGSMLTVIELEWQP